MNLRMSAQRKTRLVCISDTHNQTPKLPAGDVLIHAGDLTNQGSYAELKRTVEWLERQEFEAKIVVAGNHDITLDPPFFRENEDSWKWPAPQDTEECRRLLTESKSIIYLENDCTEIRLKEWGTCFTIFGSPCTPKQQLASWAFQYKPDEAEELWNKIPNAVDIVVTHTPPKGRCDGVVAAPGGQKDRIREGCPALLRRLEQVRPILNICGHIHNGRGVETIRWRERHALLHHQPTPVDIGTLVPSVQFWNDPGASNKKLSLVDLTTGMQVRRGRGSGCDYHASLTRQLQPDSRGDRLEGQPDASSAPDQTGRQPPSGGGEKLIPTAPASLTDVALRDSEALWRGISGGRRRGGDADEHQDESDTGHGCPDEATQRLAERQRGMPPLETEERSQTTVINAAYLGPRVAGKTSVAYNKPIVVDMELPVWGSWDNDNAS